jgi:hypothetical protein
MSGTHDGHWPLSYPPALHITPMTVHRAGDRSNRVVRIPLGLPLQTRNGLQPGPHTHRLIYPCLRCGGRYRSSIRQASPCLRVESQGTGIERQATSPLVPPPLPKLTP